MKTFQNWRYYLNSCNHKVLVITNYNNFYQFMDIKIWALASHAGLKSSLTTNFKLIIVKTSLKEKLQIFHFASFGEV